MDNIIIAQIKLENILKTSDVSDKNLLKQQLKLWIDLYINGQMDGDMVLSLINNRIKELE